MFVLRWQRRTTNDKRLTESVNLNALEKLYKISTMPHIRLPCITITIHKYTYKTRLTSWQTVFDKILFIFKQIDSIMCQVFDCCTRVCNSLFIYNFTYSPKMTGDIIEKTLKCEPCSTSCVWMCVFVWLCEGIVILLFQWNQMQSVKS